MTGLERKIELMKAQARAKADGKPFSMSTLARQLGVSQGHVSKVVSGERRSPTVEQAIAKAIGKPVARVFPPAA